MIHQVERRYRVIVAKVGLDGHDRGAKVISRALRDAGFEVIYLGLRQTAESVAAVAVQEDVDAVGISILSGAHMAAFRRTLDELRDRGVGHVVLFGGGIIPPEDRAALMELGVAELFTPGATMDAIAAWLHDTLRRRDAATASGQA